MTLKEKVRRLSQRRPGASRALVRRFFDAEFYLTLHEDVRVAGVNALQHFLQIGWAEGRPPHPMFDTDYYLRRYPDVEACGVNPFAHFLSMGWREGRDPCPEFITRFYLDQNPDVARDGNNPWVHYVLYGKDEGRAGIPFNLKRAQRSSSPASPVSNDSLATSGHSVGQPSKSGARNHELGASGSLAQSWEELAQETKKLEFSEAPAFLASAASKAIAYRPALVSIIMPTWNRRNIIDRAIRSVLNQSYQHFELVIADDGSTDGTYEYITRTYGKLIRTQKIKVIACPHGGVSAARNSALRASRGDLIAYLDSDNAWQEHFLAVITAGFAGCPQADCVYTPILINDADAPETDQETIGKPYDRCELLRSNYIDMNGFSHRRKCYIENGDFNLALNRLVDWELIIRYTSRVAPLYIPVIGVDYYLCSQSLKNITKTEAIEPNFDAIVRLHRHEYQNFGLISLNKAAQFWLQDEHADPQITRLYTYPSKHEYSYLDARTVLVLDSIEQKIENVQKVVEEYWFIDEVYLFDGEILRSPIGTVANGIPVSELPDCIVYWPSAVERMLSPMALFSAVVAIVYGELDVAVASRFGHSDAPANRIHTAFARDAVIAAGPAGRSWLRSMEMPRNIKGRILHLDTSADHHRSRTHSLNDLLNGHYSIEDGSHTFVSSDRNEIRSCLTPTFRKASLKWPRLEDPSIIIFGMKVGVGGVERLSSAISRELGKKFGTIYLALEPTLDKQGSLTNDIAQSSDLLVEFFECIERDLYPELLSAINEHYKPMALFIMNGSMWLAAHASALREIFNEAGIVDHQAYDHEVGWIQRMNEPGIQSFDRFVAVNPKIRSAFVDMGFDAQIVDEIHHGIDIKNAKTARSSLTVGQAREAFGLNPESIVAAFAGRLTDQKRPFDFLGLANARRSTRDEFLFLGDGVLREQCEQFIAEHALANVQRIPFVPNVAEAFRAVDMLVITSDYEGLPLVVVEAMCVGIPILSTDVGDIRAALETFGAGIILDDIGNPAQLERGYEKLSTNLKSYRDQAEARAEKALNHFSMENVGSLFEAAGRKAHAARALNFPSDFSAA